MQQSTTQTPSGQHLLVKSVTPQTGQAIDVGTITALVGPNNSGKSEALRDIVRLAAKFEPAGGERDIADEPQTVVISDLAFVSKLTVDRLLFGLTTVGAEPGEGAVVQGIGPDLKTPYRRLVGQEIKNILYRPILTARSVWMTALGDLMPLRVLYLPADGRTKAVASSAACTPVQAPENLLQVLHYAKASVHAELDEAFSSAFRGMHIRLDDTQRVSLSLRVASAFPTPSEDPVEAVRQFNVLRRLDDEGDGYRSFVAVVLGMLLGRGRIILLDQPEASLYPEQARHLGRWIAANTMRLGCQVFVATQDASFLTGLYEGPAEVTVVRLTRKDSSTRLHPVPGDVGKALAQFPLLASQRALDCLFHDGVVVAPQDADRVIYQTVGAGLLQAGNVAFIHAHGGGNLSFVRELFRRANIPACLVTELDAFQSEARFVELLKAATGEAPPQPWLATRERLASHVEGQWDAQSLSQSAHEVESFLDQLKQGDPTPVQISSLPETKEDAQEKWARLNRDTLESLPQELRMWVEELIEELKHKGIFVSPKGRLQGWMDVGVSPEHKEQWLVKAVQLLTGGKCPAELRAFVVDVVSHARALSLPQRAARTGRNA